MYCKKYGLFSFGIVQLLLIVGMLSAQHNKDSLQVFVESLIEHQNNMHIGIKAVSVVHNRQQCAINEYQRFTPASNIKLFTAILGH